MIKNKMSSSEDTDIKRKVVELAGIIGQRAMVGRLIVAGLSSRAAEELVSGKYFHQLGNGTKMLINAALRGEKDAG